MISSDGENLIFIFSLPRSGSTLLSMLLGGHPQVYAPPEPWFLLKLVDLTKQTSLDSIFDDGLATVGTREFLDDSSLFEAIGAFGATAYNRKLASVGKTIFVDKTPRYYHILDEIEAIFPKAKKIWLKRNPLDIAYSYKATWGMGPEVITGDRFISHTLDFSVGLFRLADFFDKGSSCKMQVAYEDIVSTPGRTLQALCDFLDISVEEQMFSFAENRLMLEEHKRASMGDVNIFDTNAVHAGSVGKGLDGFSRSELEQILSVLGLNIFSRLGYSKVSEELLSAKLKMPSESDAAEKRKQITSIGFNAANKSSAEHHSCDDEMRAATARLAALESSKSWRITKPLRWLGDLVRKR